MEEDLSHDLWVGEQRETIGVAVPSQVDEVVAPLLREFDVASLALHFHDTRATALANVWAALQLGVHIFDSSAGGLGGCPYSPGATGNLATEDLVYMLRGVGIETGVDLDRVVNASSIVEATLGSPLPTRVRQGKLAERRRKHRRWARWRRPSVAAAGCPRADKPVLLFYPVGTESVKGRVSNQVVDDSGQA